MKPTIKLQTAIILLALFITNLSIGQSDTKEPNSDKEQVELSKQSIYLDYNVAYLSQVSINYEYRLASVKNITWYGRAGLGAGYTFLGDGGPGGIAGITMLTGKKNGHFEANLGAFVGLGRVRKPNNGSWAISGNPTRFNKIFAMPLIDLGYRYQKPGSGLIFKAKVANIGLGIGLGYAF